MIFNGRRKSDLLVFVLIVSLLPMFAWAQGQVTSSDALEEARAEVRLVTGNGYYPYTDLNLLEGGLATEIVAAVYRDMGFEPDIKFGPWERGYADTLQGKFDATFPYLATQDRAREFYFTEPILTVKQVVFVRTDGGGRSWMLNNLAGRRYCLPQSYALPYKLQIMQENEQIKNRPEATVEDCFKSLANQKVDFVPADELLGVMAAIKALGSVDAVTTAREGLYTSSLHVLVPKNQTDARTHIQEFDEALDQLKVSGRYSNILVRHQKAFSDWVGDLAVKDPNS